MDSFNFRIAFSDEDDILGKIMKYLSQERIKVSKMKVWALIEEMKCFKL